ncbi:uncharacterized protein LOC118486491 [Helianthus annuus]|uniref:uncharacterized protein LOC118486491 n=1 Tax=Helianthus annuus TaxID=4232 RepID=UPI00165322C4|nr:uncharacterized protein LOC118486491 [Helianthus annuus]
MVAVVRKGKEVVAELMVAVVRRGEGGGVDGGGGQKGVGVGGGVDDGSGQKGEGVGGAVDGVEVVKICFVRDRLEGEGLWLWRHDPDSGVEGTEWLNLRAALAPVSLSDGPDNWIWLGSGSEEFSVAAIKKFIVSKKDFSGRFVMRWCRWVPQKCNIFAWRAEMYRIPTVDALANRGVVVIDDLCSFCSAGSDSVDHIFTLCPFALGLWEKISFWCRIKNFFIFSFRDLLEIHEQGTRSASDRLILHGIIISACWVLWKARNDIRFNGKRRNVEDLFSEVRVLSFFWLKHRAKKGLLDWGNWCKYVKM